jgi:hypothetical protein
MHNRGLKLLFSFSKSRHPLLYYDNLDLEIIVKLDKLVRMQMGMNDKTVFEGDLNYVDRYKYFYIGFCSRVYNT